jgi:pyridoxal phosphate enzyme (YggS family)
MPDAAIRETLKTRLSALEERIHVACASSGRSRADVTLVCVTKTVTPEIAALLPELGYSDLGESRPQELWRKAARIPTGVCWHLIGRLQRNKIERTIPLLQWLHSVDRWSLCEALDAQAARGGQPLQALLEVNVGREANKQGLSLEELPAVVERLSALRSIRIRGLMTMAPLNADPQLSRPVFAVLRQARDKLQSVVLPPHSLEQLSMGMTNDFEIAIEEGATMVRIGTALFGGLPGGAA